jgi:hypothetical protein
LAAWQEEFKQHHYWAAELGPAIIVGLSTVKFRSNRFRCAGGRAFCNLVKQVTNCHN